MGGARSRARSGPRSRGPSSVSNKRAGPQSPGARRTTYRCSLPGLAGFGNPHVARGFWAGSRRHAAGSRSLLYNGGEDACCWRRGWDLNPRYRSRYTRFPVVHLQPLGHLSDSSRGASAPRTSPRVLDRDRGATAPPSPPARSGAASSACPCARILRGRASPSAILVFAGGPYRLFLRPAPCARFERLTATRSGTNVAESEGFEPPVPLPVHLISSQAPSTRLGQLSAGGFNQSSARHAKRQATPLPPRFRSPRPAPGRTRGAARRPRRRGAPRSTGKRWLRRGSGGEVHERPDRARLRIARGVDEPVDRGASTIAPAHIAQGSSVTNERHPGEPPAAERAGGLLDGEQLGVGRRIVRRLARVRAAADDPVLEDRDGADRHLAAVARLARERERLAHGLLDRHAAWSTTGVPPRARPGGSPRRSRRGDEGGAVREVRIERHRGVVVVSRGTGAVVGDGGHAGHERPPDDEVVQPSRPDRAFRPSRA